MILCLGGTGSGKTNSLIDFISKKNEAFYKIIIFSGRATDEPLYNFLQEKIPEIEVYNDINELPIAYNIAWYEQKAVIVLLALLHLGVKNIHLGPTLPAFLSPNVANVLVENFGIAGITDPQSDIAMFMKPVLV